MILFQMRREKLGKNLLIYKNLKYTHNFYVINPNTNSIIIQKY